MELAHAFVRIGITHMTLIAQILDLSPRTVNKHLEQVFKKMSVENRTSAASIAIRLLNESTVTGEL